MATIELPSPPTDVISSVRFSPDGAKLAVSSWDRFIHIYSRGDDASQPWTSAQKLESDAPVLDVCWAADGEHLFSVGIDEEVARYDVGNGTQARTVLSKHGKPSNKLAYSAQHDLLLSTSWDGTMHVHDVGAGTHVSVQLPAKPFALSINAVRAVVGMAERKVWVYDMSALKTLVEQGGERAATQPIGVEPWQQRESSLKFMTRAIACMPDGAGFATSSIEGRVGVEWFDPELEKDTYAFKCHRDKQKLQTAEGEEEEEVDVVYPVNALAFHPAHGTFATGGGEGAIVIWDPKTKRRLKQLPQFPASVAAMEFSADGTQLAVGISPGFEDGRESEEPELGLIKVIVREISDSDVKGKPAKGK